MINNNKIMRSREIKRLDLTVLKKAYATLVKFMEHSRTEQEQAGIIQAFELCYELSWKMMKKFLYNEGIEVNSPRGAFREAAKNGIIKDVRLWFDFLEKRNETMHTYNEQILKNIIKVIPKFKSELGELIELLEERNK